MNSPAPPCTRDHICWGAHASHPDRHRLEVDSLSVYYGSLLALNGISFSITCGHTLALMGPNGAGKSTLIKALAGLIRPDSGKILWNGRPLHDTPGEIAYLPQRSDVDWSFPITVRALVEMGRYPSLGLWKKFGRHDRDIVEKSLHALGMESMADRQISELSGGQQQRAFLARALAQEAHVLLLDEPFTGLDAPRQPVPGKAAGFPGGGRASGHRLPSRLEYGGGYLRHHPADEPGDGRLRPPEGSAFHRTHPGDIRNGPPTGNPSFMMDDFLQFLREPIAQRSLLACVMIGFANGFVSGLVILKKSALQIGTLSCALLPGIAVAVLLFGLTRWSLLTGAVVAALLVGLGSLFVSRTSRLNQDTALSILHTTAFAAGFIVLVRLGLQQKIDDWLFGSIMSLSDSDLWIAFAISSVSVLILLLFRRPILICLFDPDIATTLGIPSRLISYGIFTLIILVLVSSLQAVGAFLTLGLLVGPAATVYLLTNKPAHLFWGGGIIGGLGSLLAFYLSFPLGWHLGATIILVLGVIFCTAYLYSSRCGLLKQHGKNSS
ncbi:MAG: iron chelate uptake ABC transporter family permease subunit [Akkermansia muciniphila]